MVSRMIVVFGVSKRPRGDGTARRRRCMIWRCCWMLARTRALRLSRRSFVSVIELRWVELPSFRAMAPTGEGVLLRAFLVLLVLLDFAWWIPLKTFQQTPDDWRYLFQKKRKKRTTFNQNPHPNKIWENQKNGQKKNSFFCPLPRSWNLFLPTKSDSKAASLRHSLGHQPAGVGFRHCQTLKKGRFKKVG